MKKLMYLFLVLLFSYWQVSFAGDDDPVVLPPPCPDCEIDPCKIQDCTPPEPPINPNPGSPGGPQVPPEPEPQT